MTGSLRDAAGWAGYRSHTEAIEAINAFLGLPPPEPGARR